MRVNLFVKPSDFIQVDNFIKLFLILTYGLFYEEKVISDFIIF